MTDEEMVAKYGHLTDERVDAAGEVGIELIGEVVAAVDKARVMELGRERGLNEEECNFTYDLLTHPSTIAMIQKELH